MTAEITRLGPKYQVTIPKLVREALKLETGDLFEVVARNGAVVLRPKILVDRDPELERDLAESLDDIKAGRVYGPYDAKQAVPALRALVARERKRTRREVAQSAPTRTRHAKTKAHASVLYS